MYCITMPLKQSQEQVILKANERHGDKYDYSKVVYINACTKVIITCLKCKKDFEVTPNKHISRGDGCKLCSRQKCADAQRSNVDDFIKNGKLKHEDENGDPIYGYKNINYINNRTPVLITCKKHGDFLQRPGNHLSGYGCINCRNENSGNSQRLTTEQFIEKSKKKHGDECDYSKVVYTNAHNKVIITCLKCKNDFEMAPNNHLNGQGCSYCKHKTEKKLYDALQSIYPSLIRQFKRDWCINKRYLPFDFCIPEHKIIIELDGRQHFIQVSNWTSPEETLKNDKYKQESANKNGYSVIRLLQENVFYDTYDWIKDLYEAIEEIKNGDEIVNRYLCKNNEYDRLTMTMRLLKN
jgi:very-short-patch-repair endonuclease